MKLHKSNLIFFEVNHILLFSKKTRPRFRRMPLWKILKCRDVNYRSKTSENYRRENNEKHYQN